MVEASIVETVPIAKDTDGVIRVSGTRVPLETVIDAFLDGATAEQIVQDYSTLPLADVYHVIAYYLKHKDEVDAYMKETHERAEETRRIVESRWDQTGIRERLLARRRAR